MPETHSRHFDLFVELVRGRHSMRRFLPTPVAPELVLELLDLAACAPSGVNMQPWQVHVVSGQTKTALTQAILQESEAPSFEHKGEYDYYPQEWTEPYLSRRRQTGRALYAKLGIDKKDAVRARAQWERNFRFFDAPVGLIFTLDRGLGQGSLIDYGAFLQTLMLAARARGLDSCMQAAFAEYHPIIRRVLEVPPQQMIIGGLSLGYADPAAPENDLDLPRVPAREFTRFHV